MKHRSIPSILLLSACAVFLARDWPAPAPGTQDKIVFAGN